MNNIKAIFNTSLLSLLGFSTGNAQDYHQLSSTQFYDDLSKEKITLIDVRTSGEFANGHIPDAGQLNFYALIQSEMPVFIDFYAPWCGPCLQMMPMIDSLKTEYRDEIKIVKINAEASKKLVKEPGLSGVPYFKMFNKGEMI